MIDHFGSSEVVLSALQDRCPAGLLATRIVLAWCFHLDQQFPQIQKELQERKQLAGQ